MIIGYGSSRDQLALYASGNDGVAEMATNMPDEVVFGFIAFEGAKVLVIHVSEKISGVRRARALAHQTAIAEFFDQHDVVVNTSKPSDISPAMLRDKTRHLAAKMAPKLALEGSVTATGSAINADAHESIVPDDVGSGGLALDCSSEQKYVEHDVQTTNDLNAAQVLLPADHAKESTLEAPVTTGPPTPNSFNDSSDRHSVSSGHAFDAASTNPVDEHSHEQPPLAVQSVSAEVAHPRLVAAMQLLENGTAEEFMQTDSPVIAQFDDQVANSGNILPAVGLRKNHSYNSATANPTTQANRYSSVRLRERPGSAATGVTNGRRGRASVFSSSFSPIQPEIAFMLDQISEHRKETAELAENTGVMSDKYYQCLQGYTSIQEPTSAFWKRRYFVVAENTMFLYTNECSRIPTDYLEISSIVHSPRDAEDEVLMPHSLAVDFGTGDYYMYFDTSDMMRAFEGEISKAINAA
ncbi:hypothetical protein EV178_003545 [Coemansia sp. RSA 1646]|nr:hypothetical protein EV178_003545 [Coemansia sp. RSA 1646]